MQKKYLTELIVTNELTFPYRALFIDPPEVVMKKIRDFKPQPIYDRYYLKSYYPRVPRLYLSPTFRGQMGYLIGADDHYLSDHFIENIRLKTHRQNTPSVIDYWLLPDLRDKFLDKLLQEKVLDYPTMRDVLHMMTFESKQFRPTWVKGLYQLVGIH